MPACADGSPRGSHAHASQGDLLEAAAAGLLIAGLTTLLTPFDPLIADRSRTREVFDFDFAIECYLPAAKRRYGYFCLPLLWRGQLVGRVDAKAHRQAGRFEVKTLYLEPGFTPETLDGLRALGYDLEIKDGHWYNGECIAIDRKSGELLGGQDHRSHYGKATGY